MSAVRVLLMGYGRMGRLVESLAPEAGVEIAGRVDIDNADRPADWPAADVAIDFSIAAAVPDNARRLAARGTNLVIGTTGWQDQEAALRHELAALPVGVVFAPNFALGVNLFVALAARGAELLADRPEFGAWIHELHHRAKRDAPSGTAIAIRDAMQNAGYGLTIDVASTRVGVDSGHPHRRLRQPVRDDYADTHGPGSHRLRARCARGRQVGQRPPGMVFDARRFGVVVGATSQDDFEDTAFARWSR